jgi:HSP20 family molecular chaperone IbpA
MPSEVQREDIHVGYHRSRLTVTWSTVEMIEYNEEDGIIYRERYEHTHHRTIPLPDGTRVRALCSKACLYLLPYYSLTKFRH